MVSVSSPATLKATSEEEVLAPISSELPQQRIFENDQRAATFMIVLLAIWLAVGMLIAGITAYMYR
jgi:hypothetical protein